MAKTTLVHELVTVWKSIELFTSWKPQEDSSQHYLFVMKTNEIYKTFVMSAVFYLQGRTRCSRCRMGGAKGSIQRSRVNDMMYMMNGPHYASR